MLMAVLVDALPAAEWRALVLGVIQGITEFLPVSSAAHLILAPRLLGWPDQGLTFDIAANTGTLCAVLVYFRRDLASIVTSWWRAPPPPPLGTTADGPEDHRVDAARLGPWLLLGTVPAAIAGVLVADWVATEGRDPRLIAWTTVVFGVLLLIADRRASSPGRPVSSLRWRDALWMGCAQALALAPGVSRSGVTMTAGLFVGLSRGGAARASFLLSVPVGLLVAAKDCLDMLQGEVPREALAPLVIVTVVSAIVGYLVIAFLLRFLRSRSLLVFVAYRLALGVALFAIF